MARSMAYLPSTRRAPLTRGLLWLNLMFALNMLLAWRVALLVFVGPLGWATDRRVEVTQDWSTLLDYPTILLWAPSCVAMGIGWMAAKFGNYKLAVGVMLVPVLFTIITLMLYCLLP